MMNMKASLPWALGVLVLGLVLILLFEHLPTSLGPTAPSSDEISQEVKRLRDEQTREKLITWRKRLEDASTRDEATRRDTTGKFFSFVEREFQVRRPGFPPPKDD
jgi:hypothetical protein